MPFPPSQKRVVYAVVHGDSDKFMFETLHDVIYKDKAAATAVCDAFNNENGYVSDDDDYEFVLELSVN